MNSDLIILAAVAAVAAFSTVIVDRAYGATPAQAYTLGTETTLLLIIAGLLVSINKKLGGG